MTETLQSMQKTKGYKQIISWLKADKRKPFDFQKETWQYYLDGYSGLVNAPKLVSVKLFQFF